MYTVGNYYLAKIIGEIPILSITPMFFSVIVYFKIGLSITATQFWYFYLIVLLVSQCSASFGYFISSLFENEEMAVTLTPIFILPIMLFGGQFANSGNIQDWISWFQYLSPIRYGFEAVVRNEFDYHTYNISLVLKNLTNNNTMTILNGFAVGGNQQLNMTQF